ncbi:MAG: hypothetical protein ACLTXR_00995 [Clostridia bacterium]
MIKKGNAVLIKSYSLLQDRFFKYMSDSGYKDFIRGVKGSNQEHLSDLQFKIKKDTERLEKSQIKLKKKNLLIIPICNMISKLKIFQI